MGGGCPAIPFLSPKFSVRCLFSPLGWKYWWLCVWVGVNDVCLCKFGGVDVDVYVGVLCVDFIKRVYRIAKCCAEPHIFSFAAFFHVMSHVSPPSVGLPRWDVEDLARWSLGAVDFYREVHSHCCISLPATISDAIRRYELFWLPLAFRKQDTTLVPPLDVEWVWHAHMSAPREYEQDCLATVGAIVDHCPPIAEKQKMKGIERARAAWATRYPNEPYDFNCRCASKDEGKVELHKSGFSYDLYKAVERQHSRAFQTLLPHFTDPKFIRTAVRRYVQHVTLCKAYPNSFLVPTYDITVVWGAHLCRPLKYRSDMDVFAGRILNRDDHACCDHKPESQLDLNLACTSRLWTDHGWSYHEPGTGFRGDRPPLQLLNPDFSVFSITEFTVTVNFIVFTSLPPNQKFVVRTYIHDANEPCVLSVCACFGWASSWPGGRW